MSIADLDNMKFVLRLKLREHSDLKEDLMKTKGCTLIEDVAKRQNVSGLFWGAALVDGQWVGENWLGRLWMEIRDSN